MKKSSQFLFGVFRKPLRVYCLLSLMVKGTANPCSKPVCTAYLTSKHKWRAKKVTSCNDRYLQANAAVVQRVMLRFQHIQCACGRLGGSGSAWSYLNTISGRNIISGNMQKANTSNWSIMCKTFWTNIEINLKEIKVFNLTKTNKQTTNLLKFYS